jgi:hypothetical protein
VEINVELWTGIKECGAEGNFVWGGGELTGGWRKMQWHLGE